MIPALLAALGLTLTVLAAIVSWLWHHISEAAR